MDWTYLAIMSLAIATGAAVYRRTQEPLGLNGWEKLGVGLGAFFGGMIGAKLPFVLADWEGFVDGTAWLESGKTIVSGLVGGYVGVQVAEWAMGLRVKMCDSFAAPVAAAVAVGRLACFHGGCCYGTVTSLPWGVNFGDGQLRHPTQLYESAFHVMAAVVLYQLQRRQMLRGQLIRFYFISYFLYRFATEFIRPEPELWLGLTGYQLAALVLGTFFAVWGCPCCQPQRASTPRRDLLKQGADDPAPRVLKETRTLCPTCLKPVSGVIFQQDGKVHLRRECSEHGTTVALLSSDRRHYYLRDEVPHPPPAEPACCCGLPSHRTCVALLEVTDACNLRCPVCYAQSPSGKHHRFKDLCADLDAFVAARGSLDVLQLSGGEPLLHPDLLRIIDHAKTLPIDHVMINTNGLELLESDSLPGELAKRKPRLELCLQLDGLDAESHVALRGADLLDQKQAVIKTITKHDLPTTLVCTLARGINEHQVGDLLRLGLATPQLRGITFQPATWSGRFDCAADPLDRLTLADVIRLVVEQSEGLFADDDFKPLPCANPNCCSFTFAVRPRRGRPLPLTRVIRYEDHLDRLSDRMNFNLADARQCCGTRWRREDFFRIVIKPFMDAYTYDQDRVEECCVHIIRPGGTAVSFCQFNTVLRPSHRGASTCPQPRIQVRCPSKASAGS